MENWNNFLKNLEISIKDKISNANPHREYILKDYQIRKRLVLNEIKINNINSPLEIVDKDYYIEYYQTNILVEQLKSIIDMFNTIKSIPEIMEKKEILESKKKFYQNI